ncbi:MAG: CpaD family pilus assembly protein [Pseudomonadota bacterium]
MAQKIVNILAMSAAAGLLSACAGSINGADDAFSVEEKHPISVDTQVVTLTLNVDPTTSDLSKLDEARLRAFAGAYVRSGHGPVTVTAPSGATDSPEGQELASDVRRMLHSFGLPWSSISGASYRTGDDGARQVIVSYTHYVATASECGIWKEIRKNDRNNVQSPNFGCATQNNLAALVADPRDLIAPSYEGPVDSEARIRAIELFRDGEVSSVETDEIIRTQVTN